MKFVWFSRYLLLALIVAYVVLLLVGAMGGAELVLGLGGWIAICIGFSAVLCVVSQTIFAIRRKRGAH